MQADRRTFKNFDWLTLALVLAISLVGTLTIYSGTRPEMEGAAHSYFFLKQLIWIGIGMAVLVLVCLIEYQWFARFAMVFYIVGLALLVFVLARGRIGLGAQRWISLGPLSFQPSEIFRVVFVVMLARRLSEAPSPLTIRDFSRIAPLMWLLPFALLVKQPDLGTACTVAAIFFFVSFTRGMDRKLVLGLAVFAIISLAFFWQLFWQDFLKDYQRNRLVAFLDPQIDPAGIGYHISQSKIAIGSGMVFGKGFLSGTQGPFRFLPERHTDFIFSVFSEEWGFIGCLVLLFLYFAFLMRGLDTARKAKDEFGALLALSITIMFAIYFFFNIGMTMGIMPVVGIPLPFMSYGGTAVLGNFAAAGLLMNVRLRRFELFY